MEKEDFVDLVLRHKEEHKALQENRPSDHELIRLCDKHLKELQDAYRERKDLV